MASAILASSNEQHWREPKDFMRKNPIPSPNPNPRSVLNFYAGDHAAAAARFHAMEGDEAMPNCNAVGSEDSSSLNRKPAGGLNNRDLAGPGASRYLSFHISMLSKGERRELKRRLISELNQVRSLKSRIESREIQSSARSAGFSTSGIYCGGREVTSISRPSDLFLDTQVDLRLQTRSAEFVKLLSSTMKKCGQILSKLMKNKQSGWFNSPVDVDGMGLHDYFQIIKTPMDLGTVKKKLNKGLYHSPAEFATDIRLTFNNALLYNPPGHVVHKFAEQYLLQFEGLFAPAYDRYENHRIALEQEMQKHRSPSMEMIAGNDPPPLPALSQASPVQAPSSPPALMAPPQQLARTPAKLPKPKAKDPIKRPMTLAEKQKLSEGLQSLPQDKMPQLLNIVSKQNAAASQNGDEVELDFDAMDADTLWELDRFLCNFKKTVNKMRRHEAIAKGLIPPPATGQATLPPLPAMAGSGSGSGGGDMSPKAKLTTAEEEVDIGDDLPATNYPSVEIEKNAGFDSSSCSSDSDSSSSSDSDSDQTDSDSDDDDNDGRRSPRNPEQPEG